VENLRILCKSGPADQDTTKQTVLQMTRDRRQKPRQTTTVTPRYNNTTRMT